MDSDGKPPRQTLRSLQTVTKAKLCVSPDEFKAIVVWVTNRVLEQAFDLRDLTLEELDGETMPACSSDETTELVH